MIKLYHNDMSTCAQKVRFVLHEKGLEWDSEELDLRAGDQLKPEFLRINPKGLVPTLIHDANIFAESNIIIEYLNDAFPEPALLPQEALGRARARAWMKRLDDGIHLEVVSLSFGVAFRHQLIAATGSEAALEQHFAKIPDPYIQDVQRQVVSLGVEAPRFERSIRAFEYLLRDLDAALATHQWIVGDKLTLADIAYAPYATRLKHLHLQGLWDGDDKLNFARWFEALQATAGYQAGLTKWFNPKYLPLMDQAGIEAWPRIAGIVAQVR
ncbi:MAG: glutathione S-transferase family protein [Proteobacteria bacterium]|nr:glutathione S-transferase family protein [Pseudomonadota bacterium]